MRASAFLANRSFGNSSKEPMQTQTAVSLFQLFDATLSARPYTVTLHERTTPGAAAALRAWSEANGLAATEDYYPAQDNRPAYANLTTALSEFGTRIVVLAYRTLTDEEVAVTQ